MKLPADALKPEPVHKVLPPEAQAQLQRAASTPATKADPMARTRAVNQTIEKLKLQYPEIFNQEN